ncbi:amidohydrolase family protein [Aquibacillus koreensis]|uniref:Amidohydrolase family protein n=1 Tax=Aquibacillus koreensis TaxID=279446 RepID=A0A9X3WPR1_9BACI|nr:amidohydrolase family protein [Aquibacillus koreensis]MCT2537783.1 amidohydrolase family protein [Aquibacillus koreensis]MDC3421184.1 amidohydrolase family protein [Aquibacillus koreensis]
MFNSVVKNVRRLNEDKTVNIGIANGCFAAITTASIQGEKEWDAHGHIVLPPFVEMHTHLDTTLTIGNQVNNKTGTLFEAISIWHERKQYLSEEDVINRATKALHMLMEHGVLYVRAAVDISDPHLTALKALLEVRKRMAEVLELQIIAFPQDGLMSCEENQARLIEAVEMGADAVSAVPHLERTREQGIASLEYCFSIAKQYDKFVHVFCDEIDDDQSRFLEVVADLTIKNNMEGSVTASHAIALAYYNEPYAQKVIQLVKQAELTIVACPLINSVVQGRLDRFPKGRGITRIKDLYTAGVNVCIAHDDIRTPFYPFGSGNILQAAHMGLHLAHMTGADDLHAIFQMISHHGAQSFGLEENYGIEIGKPANFITIPGKDMSDIITNQPKCSFIFRNGNLIASTEPEKTQWHTVSTNNKVSGAST